MSGNIGWRLWVCGIVFLLALIGTVPNFWGGEKAWWPSKAKMVLGLDIQGGSHLVLQIDTDSALKRDTEKYAALLKKELEREKVIVKNISVLDPRNGSLQIFLSSGADQQPVANFFEKYYPQTFSIADSEPESVTVEFADIHMVEFRKNLVDQSIATIRNRIDEFGVAEPNISAQGTNRILVQLPGIADASSAKELINKTARLDFMLVNYEMDPTKLREIIAEAEKAGNFKMEGMKYTAYVDKLNEAIKDKLPKNSMVLFEKAESATNMEAGAIPMLLKTGPEDVVPGDHLIDAYATGDEFGRPIVSFALDATGARVFGELTKNNIQKQFAIVLDKVIKSAPTIQSAIPEGRGQITMGGGRDLDASQKEAKLIAMSLRAGALPASLEQVEERTVGPSVGAEAIQKGALAALIAAVTIFIMITLFYRSFGLIASISLLLNAMITIAILSSLGATLTLPGVAGLALNIGIAVDASVIIYERIKEELGKGASMAAAIREGYDRAFSAIFDSNITSICVCIVLMYFGSGPVRGFAVTLLCGLVTTVFTAVFFTRAIVDLLVVRWKWNLAVKW